MVDIVLVASNSIIRHPRIWKIVTSLKKKYEISVLGWNREGISSDLINRYIAPVSLLGIRAPFGKPYLILYYPLFWSWILFKLLTKRPNIVHAIDLDTLIPCYLYKLLFRKKLVYDVHDRFAGYVSTRHMTLHRLINFVEELFAGHADVMVTVSKKVRDTFRSKPKENAIIMNVSEDYKGIQSNPKNGMPSLVYTGLISRDQGVDRIFSAVSGVGGVKLVLAGRVVDRLLLDEMLKSPMVEYKGLLERSESLKLESNSDIMMVLYDLRYRKNQLSSPNKVFEAMMCGIPLITNMEPDIVGKEVGCGIIVDYDNLDEIKEAIILLRDDEELRRKMGKNGRMAFEEKYNWGIMEQKMYGIYDELMRDYE